MLFTLKYSLIFWTDNNIYDVIFVYATLKFINASKLSKHNEIELCKVFRNFIIFRWPENDLGF